MDGALQSIPSLDLLATLLVVQPRIWVASLAARPHDCLLSSSLTTTKFPIGLLPATQPPAYCIAEVNPLQGQKLAFILLAFPELHANRFSRPSAPSVSIEAWETFSGKTQAKKALSPSAPLLSSVTNYPSPSSRSPAFPLFNLGF